MTPKEINIAIAEHCGWLSVGAFDYLPIPNYHGDLNAMHKAEELLCEAGNIQDPDHPRYTYIRALYHVTDLKRQPARATAAQRSEAFLRTVGGWEEEK